MSDPVAPTALDHDVPNVPAAIEFYTPSLGAAQNFTRPDTANGQQVHRIELPVSPNEGQHFALFREDPDIVVGQWDRVAPADGLSLPQPAAR